MALPNLKKAITGAAAGFAALGMSVPATAPANAQEAQMENVALTASTQCREPYTNPNTGLPYSASTSADIYSRNVKGGIGISAYQGTDSTRADVNTLATGLVNLFKRSGIEAECFINSRNVAGGTNFNFEIAGQAIKDPGSYGIDDLNENVLRLAAANARTATLAPS